MITDIGGDEHDTYQQDMSNVKFRTP